MGFLFYTILNLYRMEIIHDTEKNRAYTQIEGYTAYVEYELTGSALDIIHTYVPSQLGNRGIASQLVKYVYDYAIEHGLRPAATCPYANNWIKKHPEYDKE